MTDTRVRQRRMDGQQAITFTVPLPPRALSPNARAHHMVRSRAKNEYQEAVWIAGHDAQQGRYDRFSVGPPLDRAHVSLVWKHHRVGPDHDNALAACKALIDVLTTKSNRPLGVILDDGPDHMTVELRTEKVRGKENEGVEVTVTKVEPEQEYAAHDHGGLRHEHFTNGEHDHR